MKCEAEECRLKRRRGLTDVRGKKRGKNSPTRLYTHNVDVDAENEKELEKFPAKAMLTKCRQRKNVNRGSAKKGILAPETLRLKKKPW